jgi:hypothetical protein
MNKKGDWIPTLVDFLGALLFIAFVLLLMLLFKFSHSTFNNEITARFEETSAQTTLQQMLAEETGYMGGNASFGDLLSFYAATRGNLRDDPLQSAIRSNLTMMSKRMNIYNVRLDVFQKNPLYTVDLADVKYKCDERRGRTMLAPIGPIDFSDRFNQEGIVVEMSYCENE